MSSRLGNVPTRALATVIALTLVLVLLSASAAAQVTMQPKDEVYAGYSWLHPGGHYDFGQATIDHATGIDVSNVYYLPQAHNLGVLLDSSMHFGTDDQNIYYVLGGMQYKYHTDLFSPFARVLLGAVRQVAPTYIDEWNFAVGAGGGFDLNVWHGSMGGRDPLLAIRLAQVDYIYSNYHPAFPGYGSGQWNSIRLSAGLVVGLGNYYVAPPTAACTAQPSDVTEGEPVTVTATGSNFNPKHPTTYAWTTNGGKLDATDKQSARIDTTGVAAGGYAANATLSDPKMKKGMATCSAAFTVKAKPMNPPTVSCTANPSTVQAGNVVAVASSVSSPDSAVISSVTYAATSGSISGSGNAAALDTTGASPGTVTITVTATDARNLTGTGTCSVNVENPPAKPEVTARTPIEFINRPNQKYIPWRVDNQAKAILDDDATALKNDPNAKIVIVGYADGEPPIMIGAGKQKHAMDLAAQRAVNAKAYLVQQQGIDPSRIEVRKGTGKDHLADVFWVPQGANTASSPLLQNTTSVDESMVTPSENAYPKPAAAAPVHHHAKKPAAAPAQ